MGNSKFSELFCLVFDSRNVGKVSNLESMVSNNCITSLEYVIRMRTSYFNCFLTGFVLLTMSIPLMRTDFFAPKSVAMSTRFQ